MWSREQRRKVLLRLKDRGWISLRGAAILKNVTYVTALDHANKGKIRAVRVGKMYRVYADELCRIFNIPFDGVNSNPTAATVEHFKKRGYVEYE